MTNFTKSVTSKNALLTDKFSRIEIRFRTSIRAVSGQYDTFRGTVQYILVCITNWVPIGRHKISQYFTEGAIDCHINRSIPYGMSSTLRLAFLLSSLV